MTNTNTQTINPKWDEIILATPRATLFDNERLAFEGVESDKDKYFEIINNLSNNLVTLRRGDKKDPTPKENNAENNFDLKQPIPYVLIKRGEQIFAYERLTGGGEGGLHHKISLGAGGHMNKEEGSFSQQLLINLNRELEEELNIESSTKDLSFIGLINSENDTTSQVHIGILAFLVLAEDAEVTVKETEALRGFWATVEELKEPSIYERLESWSQIAVNIL